MMCTNACPPADTLQRLLPHGISICGAWVKQEAKQEAVTRLQQVAAASEEGVSPSAHLTAGKWGVLSAVQLPPAVRVLLCIALISGRCLLCIILPCLKSSKQRPN